MSYKITEPIKEGITIYSISNCKYCKLAINNIKSKKKVIKCDNFIKTLRERDEFYKKIEKYTNKQYIYFPMIFCNGNFIGGYKELCIYQGKSPKVS